MPAGSTLTIPVSCVEAGRWRARSKGFHAAPRAQYATGRAKRMAQVTKSMASSGAHTSDQSQVWADIAEKSANLGASSPTGAMSAIFERHGSFVDQCVDALQPVDDQVGALFAINNTIVGLDLFDSAETLTALLPKFVRSVAIDALDHSEAGAFGRVADPATGTVTFSTHRFLAAVSKAPCRIADGVGLGMDHRLTAPGLAGGALVVSDRVIHLSAFCVA